MLLDNGNKEKCKQKLEHAEDAVLTSRATIS